MSEGFRPVRRLMARVGALACLAGVASPAAAATFTVTSTNNTGGGSLRTAINSANGAAGGPHTIAFAIPTTAAGYNPATGNYVRGAQAYGPYGERHAARSYNPTTGVSKARTGGSTPYGSWERGVAVQGDNWARGGVAEGSRGKVAGAET